MTAISGDRVRNLLRRGELRELFVNELGWDYASTSIKVEISGESYVLSSIAEKRGVIAFACVVNNVPSYQTRLKIEQEVRKRVHEHLIVFVNEHTGIQIWQWVRREAGKPRASREHHYHVAQPGDSLIAKLERISFSLDEEDRIALTDVTHRTRAAFDLESVTRRFYDRFQEEHKVFLSFVKGFASHADAEWYASLMLNRLMFVYFIQKRGFIDNNRDYLQNRLEMVRAKHGADNFHSFYRLFLLRLFHDGLGKPRHERDAELQALIGAVPYLNGGLFEPHELESTNSIDIADEGFERLFAFFDSYSWHLDDRPLHQDNEINPDVLGYIFEQYINEKEELGAYYTKEDVTGYIAEHSIALALLARLDGIAAVNVACQVLISAPERYVAGAHDDSAKGTFAQIRKSAEGVMATSDTVRRSQHWKDAVAVGVDLGTFLEDVLHEASPHELWHFWSALSSLAVLDPTCGSGAFLFAAIRELQPLYEACVARMRTLVAGVELDDGIRQLFHTVTDDVASHTNTSFFIVKRIAIANLYGVDIMQEAVEICKLRLFLHLASTLETASELEPLPDLDFNVKCGNTLVGFASRDELEAAIGTELDISQDHESLLKSCEELARAHRGYREFQERNTDEVAKEQKKALKEMMLSVRSAFNGYLMRRLSGMDSRNQQEWIIQNRPFHWIADFHEITEAGGFDVVIGNPPYSDVPGWIDRQYLLQHYFTALDRWSRDEDVYTFVVERSLQLLRPGGSFGMILPLSTSFSTKRSYVLLRERLRDERATWYFSHFDRIPSALFGNDVRTRNTIAICSTLSVDDSQSNPAIYVTELNRWTAEERSQLFNRLRYSSISGLPAAGIPKLGSQVQADTLARLWRSSDTLSVDLTGSISFASLQSLAPDFPERCIFVGGTAYGWFPVWREVPPTTDVRGRPSLPARTACYRFRSDSEADAAFALLASSLGYWWWAVASDGFNLKRWLIERFPVSLKSLSAETRESLSGAGADLRRELRNHYVYKENRGKIGNWYLPACDVEVAAIDSILADGHWLSGINFLMTFDCSTRDLLRLAGRPTVSRLTEKGPGAR